MEQTAAQKLDELRATAELGGLAVRFFGEGLLVVSVPEPAAPAGENPQLELTGA